MHWTLIPGLAIAGFYVAELIGVIGKAQVPVAMNLFAALGGALIGCGLVL